MRVYLDNCCYNRPFDEQSQAAVKLESEAKLLIQALMRTGAVEYAWSFMLQLETSRNPDFQRKNAIRAVRLVLYCRSRHSQKDADARIDAHCQSGSICIGGFCMTMTITDNELRVRGFAVLAKAFGDVNAERFITLLNREPFDYTEWRKDHLFVGETVDSLMDEASSLYGEDYANRQDASCAPA